MSELKSILYGASHYSIYFFNIPDLSFKFPFQILNFPFFASVDSEMGLPIMGANDSPSRPSYLALNNITHHPQHRTQYHRWRVESCSTEFSRECPERGRELRCSRLSRERERPRDRGGGKTRTWYIQQYDVWMLYAGEDHTTLVSGSVSVWRRLSHTKTCSTTICSLQCAAPSFADAAQMRWRWWRCSWVRTNNIQPSNHPTTSNQPANRPTDQTTEATDHVSWCEARR